jgi:hypothetical protein
MVLYASKGAGRRLDEALIVGLDSLGFGLIENVNEPGPPKSGIGSWKVVVGDLADMQQSLSILPVA